MEAPVEEATMVVVVVVVVVTTEEVEATIMIEGKDNYL